MFAKPLRDSLPRLLLGLRLRCPNCGQGKTFTSLFKMEETCSVCHVRYERQSGESVGGMYINLGAAELLSIGGYFVTLILFHPPVALNAGFWILFNIIFVLLFYRHSRSLWIATVYLNGGVKTDEEYKREN